MITKWTSHLTDPAEKERFTQHILNSRSVLERIQQMLDEEEINLEDKELNWKAFESPNWANRQAAIVGYKHCLKVMKKILDLGDKNERPNTNG